MVMSRDPGSNSEKFYFSPNSVLTFRKSYQIWEKFAQEQKCYRQKNKLGVKPPPPPELVGLSYLDNLEWLTMFVNVKEDCILGQVTHACAQ